MSYYKIEQALINAYVALGYTYPISYPDKVLSDADKPDNFWIGLHNLRSLSSPVTLGQDGEDNHPGLFQIDINYPRNKGSALVLQKADEIKGSFKAGTSFTYDGQVVTVLGVSLNSGRQVDGYYRASLTVSYYARTFRNV